MRSLGLLFRLSLTFHRLESLVEGTPNMPLPSDMSRYNPQSALAPTPACTIYPVTLQTWDQLNMDDYLRNFPGGRQTGLEDFTFVNKVTNFVCGLGENCLAGQQCSPFQSQLWFVLYALQEWNLYVNSLYEAVTAAITQVRDLSADMINDFLVDPDTSHEQAVDLAIALTAVAATALIGFTIGCAGAALFPTMGVAVESGGAAAAGGAVILKRSLTKRSESTTSDLPELPNVSPEGIQKSDATLASQMNRLGRLQSSLEKDLQLRLLRSQEAGDSVEMTQDPSGEGGNPLAIQKEIRDSIMNDSVWASWMKQLLLNGNDGGKYQEVTNSESFSTQTFRVKHSSEQIHLQRRSAPQSVPKDHFKTWTTINTYLTSFRDHLRAVIAVTSKIGITSPISSDEGVWGILKGGKFMTPNPSKASLQQKTRETAKLSALAQVLKAMNVFVTIGSDKCDGPGPGGAWQGDEYLSYCSPEGLMMNLVRGAGKKTINKIFNADLIQNKYGYSVEFLAQSAWACQERNLKIDGRPSPIGLKEGSKVGCTFDIPVCDTRTGEVVHLRRKGETTVVACRKGLSLNI